MQINYTVELYSTAQTTTKALYVQREYNHLYFSVVSTATNFIVFSVILEWFLCMEYQLIFLT